MDKPVIFMVKILSIFSLLLLIFDDVAFASDNSNLKINIVPNSDIDIVLSLGKTSVSGENFESDIKRELRNLGIDTSRVKVQSVEATEQSTFAGKFTMNIYWTDVNGRSDVDTYLDFINTSGSSLGYLYFGNRTGLYGSTIDIDDTNGNTGEWTTVNFDTVPSDVNTLDFKADLYSGSPTNVKFSLIRTLNGESETMVTDTKYVSGKNPNFTSFGKLVRNGDAWDFRYTDGTVYPGKVTVIKSKEFTEVLRQPEWRENSKKILVNMEETNVDDFNNANKLGEILPRLSNEDIHFIAYGNNSNKTQQENIIKMNNNKGAFYQINDYNQAVKNTARYIKNLIDSENSDSKHVLVGENVDISVNPSELLHNTQTSDYPLGRWKIDHDYSYFDNNLGQATWANQYQKDLLMSFDKPGRYEVFFEDSNPDPRYIYAHRKPIANFSVSFTGASGTIPLTYVDRSYDPDRESSSDKGIKAQEWKWRETTNPTWNNGKLDNIQSGKNYIVQLRVQDEYGVWSNAIQKYVTTDQSTSIQPIANFTVTPTNVTRYETLKYEDTSYTPNGLGISKRDWTVTNESGNVVYSGSTPLTSFSGMPLGTYKIALKVANTSNVESETFVRTINVIKDTFPPEAIFNLTGKDWTNNPYNVTATFNDVGGSGFKNYSYKVDNSPDFPTSGLSAPNTSKNLNISITDDGVYYVHIKAFDNEGNEMKRTSGPYKLDKTPPKEPKIHLSETNWTAPVVSFTITNNGDGNGSGISTVQYRIKDGTWKSYTDGSHIDIPSNLAGKIPVEARITDNIGNVSDTTTVYAYIDDKDPIINGLSFEKINDDTQNLVVDAVDNESGLMAPAYKYSQQIIGKDSSLNEINGGWYNDSKIKLPTSPSATKYIYQVQVRDYNEHYVNSKQVAYISAPVITFAGVKKGDFDNKVTIDFADSVGKDVAIKVYREGEFVAKIENGKKFVDEGLDYERDYNYEFVAESMFDGEVVKSLPEKAKVTIGKPTLEMSLDSSKYYKTPFTDDFSVSGKVSYRKGGTISLKLMKDNSEVVKNELTVTPYVKSSWHLNSSQIEDSSVDYKVLVDLKGYESTNLYNREFDITVNKKDVTVKKVTDYSKYNISK